MGTRSRSFSALLALAWLLTSSPLTTAQDSLPNSEVSEPLWQALLPIAEILPNSYEMFMADLTKQVQGLQTNNASLANSNLALLDSNNSLTLENAGLRISLQASQEAAAISESKSEALAKDLSGSTASTTQALAKATALEMENSLLRYGMIGAVVVTVAAVIIAAVK